MNTYEIYDTEFMVLEKQINKLILTINEVNEVNEFIT